MKIKTNELQGAALDWAVEFALLSDRAPNPEQRAAIASRNLRVRQVGYSTDWSQGGPIIERAGINIYLRYASQGPNHVQDTWDAIIKPEFYTTGRPRSGVKSEVIKSGPTPLIAAMRCFVASKLGDEVDVPEELV